MSKTILITLNNSGNDPGPYTLTLIDGLGNETVWPNNPVTKAQLIAGYQMVVPDLIVKVKVQSQTCTTYIELTIPTTQCPCRIFDFTQGSYTFYECGKDSSTNLNIGSNTLSYCIDSLKGIEKVSGDSNYTDTGICCDANTVNPVNPFKSTTTSTTTTASLCKCHAVEITGTVDLSWVDCNGDTQTFNYSDITVNVCARQGSITTSGSGTIDVFVGSSCALEEDCWPEFPISVNNIDRFALRQLLIWGSPYTADESLIPWLIDYGDGNVLYFTGSQTINPGDPADHSYLSPFTGTVKIKLPSLSLINTIIERIGGMSYTTGTATVIGADLATLNNLYYIQNLNWELNADTTELPTNLNNLYSLNGTITGDAYNLPSTLTQIVLLGNETNTLSGTLNDLPTGLTLIQIAGSNTISGSINGLTCGPLLTSFVLFGSNSITGDLSYVSGWSSITEFYVRGVNTLYGDVCSFNNNIETIRILGYSSPSGSTTCLGSKTSLTILQLENDETDPLLPPGTGTTLTGDIDNLPNSLQTVIVGGYNTLSGNIITMPTSINNWFIRGENTITGDIASINIGCVKFYNGGYNTLYGNIGNIPNGLTRFMLTFKAGGSADLSGITGFIQDIPSGITQFQLYGNHTVYEYTVPRAWPANMNYFEVRPTDRVTYAIPTIDLDNLIIDLANASWTRTIEFANELYLVGTRSSASDAAIATLSSIAPPNDLTIDINP
jgi:hypothetical protein